MMFAQGRNDEALARAIRVTIGSKPEPSERKMFGGLVVAGAAALAIVRASRRRDTSAD
jgi:hypothetical protein